MVQKIALTLVLCSLLAACGQGQAGTLPAHTDAPALASTDLPAHTDLPAPTDIPAPTPYPTPDLSGQPLVWFAPLPPLSMDAGRPFTGAQDWDEIFTSYATWQTTAERINVFKLYAEWVRSASDSDLQAVIDFTSAHGIALALEDGPIAPQELCSGRESGGGPTNIRNMAQRIKNLGGQLRFIAMDEPYYQFVLDDGPGACRWSAEKLAGKLNAYRIAARQVFPQVVVGDIEVLHADIDPVVYAEWLSAFRAANGYDLPFLHMDVDYSGGDWAARLSELETLTTRQGIDFGVIFFGNWNDLSDENWLASTGERVRLYEEVSAGLPGHVIFQSWQDHPDRTLPESDATTFTGFLKTFFDDPASLGFRTGGAGANLAYGKSVHVSRALSAYPAELAVDGDPGTFWNAGDFAPQWIEIDLGAAYPVAEIRLRLTQDPAGRTIHNVYTRGAGSAEVFVLRGSFDGDTHGMDQLVLTLPAALEIRSVRVETSLSPSWIGFCEIEIIAAE